MDNPQEVLFVYLLAAFILVSILAVPLYKVRSLGYWAVWICFCLFLPLLTCMAVNAPSRIPYTAIIVVFGSHALMVAVIRKFKNSGALDERQSKLAISFLCLFLAIVPLQASLYAVIFDMGLAAYVIFLLGVTIPAAAALRVILMFMK